MLHAFEVRGQPWQLLFNDDTGHIFVPAAASGRAEVLVLFCAAYDDVPVLRDDRHYLVPLDWLERQYPADRHRWTLMRSAAERAQEEIGPPSESDLDDGEPQDEIPIPE